MANYIDIKADFDEVNEYLGDIGKQGRTISRYVLSNIARITAKHIKKSYNLYLRKRSCNLYKNIKHHLSKRGMYDVVSSNAKSSNMVGYGYVNASGADIKAKNGKYLTFQIDGKWVKKASVKIPSKNFIEEPGERYLRSTQMKDDMDFYLQKKLDALEKKGKIEVIRENNT